MEFLKRSFKVITQKRSSPGPGKKEGLKETMKRYIHTYIHTYVHTTLIHTLVHKYILKYLHTYIIIPRHIFVPSYGINRTSLWILHSYHSESTSSKHALIVKEVRACGHPLVRNHPHLTKPPLCKRLRSGWILWNGLPLALQFTPETILTNFLLTKTFFGCAVLRISPD